MRQGEPTVVFRPPRWVLALTWLPLGVLLLLTGIGILIGTTRVPKAVGVAFVVWSVLVLYRAARTGLLIKGGEIHDRDLYRTVRVRIVDVVSVVLPEGRGRLVLELADGRSVRLGAVPETGRFRQKCYEALIELVDSPKDG